jgi:hypothetical protein
VVSRYSSPLIDRENNPGAPAPDHLAALLDARKEKLLFIVVRLEEIVSEPLMTTICPKTEDITRIRLRRSFMNPL